MKYTVVIQWSEGDRCFDALRTKKPGFLTETEGFNGVFSLKNPRWLSEVETLTTRASGTKLARI
ncbi:MAG: hypothetical protein ACBR12_09465 [Microcoleus sp.]|uniref:hypothetical protein n=1 Tax=Microcoleus sp. TaxID=44472 RepID=UPI003523261A